MKINKSYLNLPCKKTTKTKMKKTKTFELLHILSKKEFLDFEFYLKHFTKSRETSKCIQLYALLKKAYQKAECNWNKADITKDKIETALNKNGQTAFRKLCTELLRYLEEYCAFLQMRTEKNDYLLRFCAMRNKGTLFEKVYNESIRKINFTEGLESLQQKCNILEQLHTLEFTNNPKVAKTDFNELFLSFSDFALIKQLRWYCMVLNRDLLATSFQISTDVEEEIDLILKLETKKTKRLFVLQFYQLCIKMLKGNDKSYFQLKELLINNRKKIDVKDQKIFFNMMHSFCMTNKDISFRNESLLNYFYRFETGLLEENGYIAVQDVKNLCSYATLRTKMEEELAMTMTDAIDIFYKTTKKIKTAFRISTRNYHLGTLYFFHQEYNNVLKFLKPLKTEKYANPYFHFDSRLVLVRTYYELQEEGTDKLERGIRNFKSALDNDDFLSKKDKESYYNFVLAMRKLNALRYTYGYDQPKAEKHYKDLQKILEGYVSVKSWFISKLEDFKFN